MWSLNEMKISRILHAGYLFEHDGACILFDPIFENPFSRNCYAYPDVEFDHAQISQLNVDAVFISHYHDDHCSLESLQYVNRKTPIYLYCIHEELFSILRELGFQNVNSLKTDVPIQIRSFEVVARLALDSDVDSIFHIKAGGVNVLNVVDAWIDPSAMSKLTQTAWDLVLWPFQTMREIAVIAPELASPPEFPPEWIEQLRALNARFVVPSSCQFIHEEWSWYRKQYFPISYQRFENEIKTHLPESTVCRLNPGVSIELDRAQLKLSAPLAWVRPKGPQDVDYDYDPGTTPTATAEIAKHFKALSEEQTRRVVDYCTNDLVTRYTAMNTGLSGEWALKLFDHRGEATVFNYELKDGTARLLKTEPSSQWITEVPISKVYAALEEGESLSSMYLRMQGMPFDEIFEDPLIACLFAEGFVAYQRAQLKRLFAEGIISRT